MADGSQTFAIRIHMNVYEGRVFIDEGGLWTSDVPQGSLMIMLNPLYRQFVWRDMSEKVPTVNVYQTSYVYCTGGV